VIMASKVSRLGRDVGELTRLARERKRAGDLPAKQAPKQVKVG